MKTGIVGLGHLGKIHLKLLKELLEFNVVTFFDANLSVIGEITKHYQIQASKNYEELLSVVDAVVIVTPTLTHYELAAKAIKQGKHVFIEKPATLHVAETTKLAKLAREAGVIVQVGHVERYNPAFIVSRDSIKNPYLIEAERLAFYNVRGTDVSVVMDLMIHDIDLVLTMVKSKIKRISATGKALVSHRADIACAIIEFENGCMAKLTANRISQHNIRKLDVFQDRTHIYIDLLNKTSTVTDILPYSNSQSGNVIIETGDHQAKYELHTNKPMVNPNNAIKMELLDFYKSIHERKPISVSLNDAEAALMVANQIDEQIH